MHKLHCVIGDNDNPEYKKEIDVEVTGKEAYAITHTWEDDNEKDYDRFCDYIGPKFNLPYSWYFDKIEDYGEV